MIRIYNLVRCVRGGSAELRTAGPKVEMRFVRQNSERSAMLSRSPDGPPRRGGPGNGPPSGVDWVRRLDRDGDDKVSRREFDGPADHFELFDRNRDDYIDSDEAPTGPQPHDRRPPRPPRPRR